MSIPLSTNHAPALCVFFVFALSFGLDTQTRLVADDFQRVSQLSEPPSFTASIVRQVRTLVEQSHVLAPEFNDEISARGFDSFLKKIDPKKSIFLALDIHEFQPYQFKLDDQLRDESIAFAYIAYKRFLKRLDQIMPIVHEQIDVPHDFNVDETIPADAKMLDHAKDLSELTDRWRKWIKLDFLSLRLARSAEKNNELIRGILHQRYRDYYREVSQWSADDLLEVYLSSLTSAIDPHTNYKAPLTQERFENELKLEMSGIGAVLKQVEGATFVDAFVPGGAAEIDGRLRIGDQLIAIAQDDGSPPTEIQNLRLIDVVKLIRGRTGTKIKMHVRTMGSENGQVYEIERALIKLDDATAKSELIVNEIPTTEAPLQFGYIKLDSFYQRSDGALNEKMDNRSATHDLKSILHRFRERRVDAVILDLSQNDRGALSEAISATGLFIDRGPVVQVKSRDGKIEVMEDQDQGVAWEGPLVVMISHMSTSASEVLAGAIQDYARGLLVGDPKTHGKGTVQRIVDIATDKSEKEPSQPYGALKLTAMQFYRPDGQSTQRVGVASNIQLPSLSAKLDISESDLDYALLSDNFSATQHRNYRMVDDLITSRLQQSSDERVANEKDFSRLRLEIDAYMKQKGDESISLNETKYRARRSELTKEKIRESYLGANKEGSWGFQDHFYHREVLRIARDYVDLLRSAGR